MFLSFNFWNKFKHVYFVFIYRMYTSSPVPAVLYPKFYLTNKIKIDDNLNHL